ncbi:MAG: hypothetical protein ACKOBV_06615 [Candidatus Kapaibacterium sp.]
MRILVQRYLDGDLNDVERAAFLDDVAHDTQLAEVLENETRLDMAIVDDAFTINRRRTCGVPISTPSLQIPLCVRTPHCEAPQVLSPRVCCSLRYRSMRPKRSSRTSIRNALHVASPPAFRRANHWQRSREPRQEKLARSREER